MALFESGSRLQVHGRVSPGPRRGTRWTGPPESLDSVLSTGLITGNSATAETIAPLTLKVLIVDKVGVPADTLRRARQETSRIFDALQIGLVWVEDVPQGHYLVIKIVTKAPSQKSKDPNMLGVAAGSQEGLPTHAWLFYSRILNQQRALHLDVSLLLGHVMAHEMGHLLLPVRLALGSRAHEGRLGHEPGSSRDNGQLDVRPRAGRGDSCALSVH